MNKTIGFIGTGNMGTAMIKGIVAAGIVPAKNIFVHDVNTEKLKALQDELGVSPLETNEALVEKSDVVLLAVKPNMVKSVLEGCKDQFTANKILISIAVGLPLKLYREILGTDVKIIRAMPNTPALVGEGMTIISFEKDVTEQEEKLVTSILECTGKVEVLEERLMNEVTAVTGSSPAYVFMFIEAMADAAVQSGIPRALAYKLASQAVLGAAKMVLETGRHPGELKDQVCSPGGTTIEAVRTLEKRGFRFAVMDAMNECTEKAREIGKIYG